MSYYSQTNLMNSPYAERMTPGQAREFKSHINPDREVPAWVLALAAKQQVEAEEEVIDEEWEALEEERRHERDFTAGFSCHGPFEDPRECIGNCECCSYWQMDDEDYLIFTKYLARRDYKTEKARAEALTAFVAEYHAWLQELRALFPPVL